MLQTSALPRWLHRFAGAAVLIGSVAVTSIPATALANGPTAAAMKTATDSFKEGVQLFQAKKFALALEKFKTSYAAVNSPNSRLYIARCEVEMGNPKQAYVTFSKVIAEAEARGATEPKYLPTRDSAKVEQEEVLSKLATVTVNVQGKEASTRLRVAGAPLPEPEWGKPQVFEPGKSDPSVIELVLETEGRETVSQRVELATGKRLVIDMAVPAAKVAAVSTTDGQDSEEAARAVDDDLRLLPYTIGAGGVGVIGMTLFAVAGGMSNGTYSELESLCGAGPCPTDQNDLVDRGQTEQTVANVGAIIGAIGLTAGATLMTLDLLGFDDEGQPLDFGRVQLDASPGWVGLRGAF